MTLPLITVSKRRERYPTERKRERLGQRGSYSYNCLWQMLYFKTKHSEVRKSDQFNQQAGMRDWGCSGEGWTGQSTEVVSHQIVHRHTTGQS